MTYHTTASRRAAGHRPNRKRNQETSPRLAVSFPEPVLAALSATAAARNVPAATLIREALEQYLERQGIVLGDGK